jgi:hypothetical protein
MVNTDGIVHKTVTQQLLTTLNFIALIHIIHGSWQLGSNKAKFCIHLQFFHFTFSTLKGSSPTQEDGNWGKGWWKSQGCAIIPRWEARNLTADGRRQLHNNPGCLYLRSEQLMHVAVTADAQAELVAAVLCPTTVKVRGPFLTSLLGANFDPRVGFVPHGLNFVPSILLNSRECSPGQQGGWQERINRKITPRRRNTKR